MELKNNQWNVVVITGTGWMPDDWQLIGNANTHFDAMRILSSWRREHCASRFFHETVELGKTTEWQEGATKGIYNRPVGFVKWVSLEHLSPVYHPEFDKVTLLILEGYFND